MDYSHLFKIKHLPNLMQNLVENQNNESQIQLNGKYEAKRSFTTSGYEKIPKTSPYHKFLMQKPNHSFNFQTIPTSCKNNQSSYLVI